MKDPIKTAVLQAIDEVFNPQSSPILPALLQQPDFKFRDVSDSSLKLVEFCMVVEEKLAIEIEFSDLLEHPTMLRFCAWLAAQSSAA